MPTVSLRPATLDDLDRLRAWSAAPHVQASLGADAGFEWPNDLQRTGDGLEINIIQVDGRPIGVIVVLNPAVDTYTYWGEVGDNVRALDVWIGEADMLGQGYGSTAMRLAIDNCFTKAGAARILIDPLASNTRAIAFYARLGFQVLETRVFETEVCTVMSIERDHWRSSA